MSPPPPPPEPGHEEEPEEVVINPVKPETAAAEGQGNGAFINIKVTSQTAPDVLVRVKRGMKLQRIMDQYCGEHSLDPGAVTFLNEDKYVRGAQTAEAAGLEDGSSISVHLRSDGGGGQVGDGSSINVRLNQQAGSGRTSV